MYVPGCASSDVFGGMFPGGMFPEVVGACMELQHHCTEEGMSDLDCQLLRYRKLRKTYMTVKTLAF